MTKHQSSLFYAFLSTEKALTASEPIWTGSIIFSEIVNDDFLPVVADIKKYKMIQAADIKGIRLNKVAKRQSMSDKSFKISNAVQALATRIGDNNLYNQGCTDGELMRGREESCVDKARHLEQAARDNATALIPYGITTAMLDSFLTSINVFELAIADCDNAIDAQKDATRRLIPLFQNGRNIILKSMKKAAAEFSDSNSDFFARLKDSFQIKGLPVFHTDLDFLITEKGNGTVLPGVKVTATPVSNPETVLNQYSNMQGLAPYTEISPEIYNIKFELPDHETVTRTVEAEKGKKVAMNIQMVKLSNQ
jgi:hypothetical protein